MKNENAIMDRIKARIAYHANEHRHTYEIGKVALETIRRWGFQYKTAAFVWVKRNRKSPSWFWGLGNWTRANAEICLLATKGKPKRASASVHSIIDAPIGRHSEKPAETRDRIVQLAGGDQ